MLSDASLSPRTRQIPDLDEKIKKLEDYESKYKPIVIDFENIVGKEKWTMHWENCKKLHSLMQESQKLSDEIRHEIIESVEKKQGKN